MARRKGKGKVKPDGYYQHGKTKKSITPIRVPKQIKENTQAAFYILDKFTANDIERWNNRSSQIYSYSWKEYSHYVDARSKKIELLYEALNSEAKPYSFDNWYRVIDYQYSTTPLSAKGSRISASGGRFNIGLIDMNKFSNFACLYIGENETVSYCEKFQKTRSPVKGLSPTDFGLKSESSYSTIRLTGKLDSVLDTSNSNLLKPFLKQIRKIEPSKELIEEAKSLGLNPPTAIRRMKQLTDALTDPHWSGPPLGLGIPSASQIFGQLAKSAGIQGLLYKSKFSEGKCLAIFPENIANSSSYIKVADNTPNGVISTLDESTWIDLI